MRDIPVFTRPQGSHTSSCRCTPPVSGPFMHPHLQELWEDMLSRHSGSGFGAEEQVLGHVLGPSSLCRFSLRDTLANLGAQLTMGELEACGVQELRSYVAGAVQTLQRRCDGWRGALARGGWVVGCGLWQCRSRECMVQGGMRLFHQRCRDVCVAAECHCHGYLCSSRGASAQAVCWCRRQTGGHSACCRT